MRFYFHEDAEAEFDRAVEYYEDSRSGLGLEFAQKGLLCNYTCYSVS